MLSIVFFHSLFYMLLRFVESRTHCYKFITIKYSLMNRKQIMGKIKHFIVIGKRVIFLENSNNYVCVLLHLQAWSYCVIAKKGKIYCILGIIERC